MDDIHSSGASDPNDPHIGRILKAHDPDRKRSVGTMENAESQAGSFGLDQCQPNMGRDVNARSGETERTTMHGTAPVGTIHSPASFLTAWIGSVKSEVLILAGLFCGNANSRIALKSIWKSAAVSTSEEATGTRIPALPSPIKPGGGATPAQPPLQALASGLGTYQARHRRVRSFDPTPVRLPQPSAG